MESGLSEIVPHVSPGPLSIQLDSTIPLTRCPITAQLVVSQPKFNVLNQGMNTFQTTPHIPAHALVTDMERDRSVVVIYVLPGSLSNQIDSTIHFTRFLSPTRGLISSQSYAIYL